MKKTFIACILAMITGGTAYAGDTYYVESNNYFTDQIVVPQVQSFYTHAFTGPVGGYAFFQVYPTYAQVYAGPTYSPADWIQLGIAAGIEQSPDQWRSNAFAFLIKDSYSALMSFEYGPSGYYYLMDAGKQINGTLTLGVFAQRFTGIGPKASVSFAGTPLSLWVVPSYDPESKLFGGVAALRGSFNP